MQTKGKIQTADYRLFKYTKSSYMHFQCRVLTINRVIRANRNKTCTPVNLTVTTYRVIQANHSESLQCTLHSMMEMVTCMQSAFYPWS